MRPFMCIPSFGSRDRVGRLLLVLAGYLILLIIIVLAFAWLFQYFMHRYEVV